jgi:hypothetical protein
MKALKIKITKFIDSSQPGFIECRFTDAWNKEHIIHEKVPVITDENLDEYSNYPTEGIVSCEILREYRDENGKSLITISTENPWDISTIEDANTFDILQYQLTDIA